MTPKYNFSQKDLEDYVDAYVNLAIAWDSYMRHINPKYSANVFNPAKKREKDFRNKSPMEIKREFYKYSSGRVDGILVHDMIRKKIEEFNTSENRKVPNGNFI